MSELTTPALIDSKNYDNWQQLLTARAFINILYISIVPSRLTLETPATVETAMTSGQGITRNGRGLSEWQPEHKMLVCNFLFIVNSKKKRSGTRLLPLKYDDCGIQLGVS